MTASSDGHRRVGRPEAVRQREVHREPVAREVVQPPRPHAAPGGRSARAVCLVNRSGSETPWCRSRSRLPGIGVSTVTTSAVNPAARARRTSCSAPTAAAEPVELEPPGPSAAAATSSIEWPDIVLIVNDRPGARAPRAAPATSPPGAIARVKPTGASRTGRATSVPRTRRRERRGDREPGDRHLRDEARRTRTRRGSPASCARPRPRRRRSRRRRAAGVVARAPARRRRS